MPYCKSSGNNLKGLFFVCFKKMTITRFPLLRFRSALHCGYSGITDQYSRWLIFCPDPCKNFKKKLGSGAR